MVGYDEIHDSILHLPNARRLLVAGQCSNLGQWAGDFWRYSWAFDDQLKNGHMGSVHTGIMLISHSKIKTRRLSIPLAFCMPRAQHVVLAPGQDNRLSCPMPILAHPDQPSAMSPVPRHGDTSAILRSVASLVHHSEAQESLAAARHLLDDGSPHADRQAVRAIALWLMSHPQAADDLRRHLVTLQMSGSGIGSVRSR